MLVTALLPVWVGCSDRVEFGAFPPDGPMEAERVNAIESSLADLDARARELRRYL